MGLPTNNLILSIGPIKIIKIFRPPLLHIVIWRVGGNFWRSHSATEPTYRKYQRSQGGCERAEETRIRSLVRISIGVLLLICYLLSLGRDKDGLRHHHHHPLENMFFWCQRSILVSLMSACMRFLSALHWMVGCYMYIYLLAEIIEA